MSPIPTPHLPLRALAVAAALLVGATSNALAGTSAKDKPAATKAGAPTSHRATHAKPASASAKRPGAAKARSAKARAGKAAHRVARKHGKAATVAAKPKPPAPKVATVAPRPEPRLYIPPPLGPERYYPNGIPELRPEFMHPVPGDATAQR